MSTLAERFAAQGVTAEDWPALLARMSEVERRALGAEMKREAEHEAWTADVIPKFQTLLQPSRYKGAHGGRGSGKSHFFGDALVEKALMQPGLRWVCLRETQKSLRFSSKQLIEDKIASRGVKGFDVQRELIGTPGGGVIVFQGMQDHTADSVKSLEAFDGAWFEEAQSASQRSLDLLRPTIRKDGSELWFSWNPNDADDPIDVLLRKRAPPDAVVVEANYGDNPHFPAVLKAEMEWDRERDPDKYAHVWLGRYRANSEARVFRNWRVEEFETPLDAEFRYGADWGFSTDPTVLVRAYLRGRTMYVDREAYQVGCKIDHTPQLFDTVPGSRKWRITADTSRPETIQYMRDRGFNIAAALKGARSVEEGVEFLKSFDIVVHPSCVHTADELSAYSYKIDRMTEAVMPMLSDKDNHVIDALRYALEGLRRASPDFITWDDDTAGDYARSGANRVTGY